MKQGAGEYSVQSYKRQRRHAERFPVVPMVASWHVSHRSDVDVSVKSRQNAPHCVSLGASTSLHRSDQMRLNTGRRSSVPSACRERIVSVP
jgi:hypothetical protein